jgi:serpin B
MTSSSVTGLDAARQQAAAVAEDRFGIDLYRRLGANQQNLVFSPASIAAALQMALAGARGSTAAQLAAALKLGQGDPAGGARDGLLLLSAAISAGQGSAPDAQNAQANRANRANQDPTPILRAPSSLWVQAGLPLEPAFTSPLQDLAAALVREADFRGAPQQARSAINELISEQTEGKITNLLGRDAVTASTRLVLANAVYLKAPWAFPFTNGATRDAPFHPEAGGTSAAYGRRLGPEPPAERGRPAERGPGLAEVPSAHQCRADPGPA